MMNIPTTPLTPLEVIDLVVETYVKHPENRSLQIGENRHNVHTCLYHGPEGKTCAFGFFCISPQNLEEGKSALVQLRTQGVEILQPRVKHIAEARFWADVQYIHDGVFLLCEPGEAASLLAKYPKLKEEHLTFNCLQLFNQATNSYYPWVYDFVAWLKEKWKSYNPQPDVQSGVQV